MENTKVFKSNATNNIMKLKCPKQNCGNEWEYIPRKNGKERATTTCSKCKNRVAIPKENQIPQTTEMSQETKKEKEQDASEKSNAVTTPSDIQKPEKEADTEQENPRELEIMEEPETEEPKASKSEYDALPYECPDCKCRFDELDNGRCPNPRCRAELEDPRQ